MGSVYLGLEKGGGVEDGGGGGGRKKTKTRQGEVVDKWKRFKGSVIRGFIVTLVCDGLGSKQCQRRILVRRPP